METQIFEFKGKAIEFGFEKNNVMVNATEMGRLYDKLPKDFLKSDSTKSFIDECLKKDNSPFLGIEKEEDLVISRQNSGTYMHRILALKFAAWLNPTFELWVYKTIDYILFEHYKQLEESLKQSAVRKNRMDELREKLRINSEYQELEQLELTERQAAYSRGKQNRNQLELFRGDPIWEK